MSHKSSYQPLPIECLSCRMQSSVSAYNSSYSLTYVILNIAEEVRVELIDLLDVCLDADPQQFHLSLGAICTMLGRAG